MAVCVYTVCNESRFLIVRNVPALGCDNELSRLFRSYGEIEECKPMDAEDSELFTDIYWIKFSQISSARFAKRKLDDYLFIGNRLQVLYAPEFESPSDTKEKLEGRKKEVPGRINRVSADGSKSLPPGSNHFVKIDTSRQHGQAKGTVSNVSEPHNSSLREHTVSSRSSYIEDTCTDHVSADKEYFLSSSMNDTVRWVRHKLNKIKSSSELLEDGPLSKKTRVDNRRRI